MATLYVKDPSGTTYNMTIVTSGTTESIFGQNCWFKLPNGLLIQLVTYDVGSQTSGSSRWWIPLSISQSVIYSIGAIISAAGLPQGSMAYNGFNGSHVSIVCADSVWNWWPENTPFGVMLITVGE